MAFRLGKRQQVLIRRQWQLFCLAMMFFTRIPLGQHLPYSERRMNQANRYFSLVGLVLGMIVALSFYGFSMSFSPAIALVLTLIVSVLLTGAFHEDGLADMADGIGGGYSIAQRLTIMKDSRLGTYGAITLFLALLLKFYLWLNLAEHSLFFVAVIIAYPLSRAVAASLIYDTQYVTEDRHSKSKPLAMQQSKNELKLSLLIATIPVVFLLSHFEHKLNLIIWLAVGLFLFRMLFRRWLLSRLGGFTGDCLGGAQQISELIIYLILVQHIADAGVA